MPTISDMEQYTEYRIARKLVETHVERDVAELVLAALDEWHDIVVQGEIALDRIAQLDTSAMLTARQVAEWFNISKDAVYKLVNAEGLLAHRIGGQIRIPVTACRDYLDEQATAPPERPKRLGRPRPKADVDTIAQYPWLKGGE